MDESYLRSGSKYDFVKIKVLVSGDDEETTRHYFILSRFLVSRTLMSTKIPQKHAVRIALELKKRLVATNQLVITQRELEATLFSLIVAHGFGNDAISRYKMLSRFHHDHRSLIVMIGGSGCVGKSTIATRLCDALNLPCVLQTDVVLKFTNLVNGGDDQINWSCPNLIPEFQSVCRKHSPVIMKTVEQTVREGKSLVVEGLHLDPQLFVPFVETLRQTSSGTDASVRPIVVMFILTTDRNTHSLFLESKGVRFSPAEVFGLGALQDHLATHAQQLGVPCVPVSLQMDTESLHSTVLDQIIALYNFCDTS